MAWDHKFISPMGSLCSLLMTWVSLHVSVPFTNLTGDGGRLSRDGPGGWCDYVGVTTATATPHLEYCNPSLTSVDTTNTRESNSLNLIGYLFS